MLYQTINTDYVQAMKSKDTLRSSTLNFLRAQIKNVMIDKRIAEIDDAEVVAVIKKQVKQRLESITQYSKGGRKDLADKEQLELDILKTYLPQEMPAEELEAVIHGVIQETGVSSLKDMGAVMKAVTEKCGGRADNRTASGLIKKALENL